MTAIDQHDNTQTDGPLILHEGRELRVSSEQAQALVAARLIHEFEDEPANMFHLGSLGNRATTMEEIHAFLASPKGG